MKPREALLDGLTVVALVTAIAVGATRLFVAPRSDAQSPSRVSRQADWREFAADGHAAGPLDAPATVVLFSDFQCPFCRTFDATYDSLAARFAGRVRLVYRHAPSRSHPHATDAATAAVCAGFQGRFDNMRRALFRDQRSLGQRSWASFAVEAAVPDTTEFMTCLEDEAAPRVVSRDDEAARRLQLVGTPTILFNSTRFIGDVSLSEADSLLRALLEQRRD